MTSGEILDALNELRRERGTRSRVYPRWIIDGRITQLQAEQRLKALDTAIAIVEAQAPQPRLV